MVYSWPWLLFTGSGEQSSDEEVAAERFHSQADDAAYQIPTAYREFTPIHAEWVSRHYMSRLKQKGSLAYFDQNVYFPFFWMLIILRLVCEIFSRIAVKISFLWCPKHGVYAAPSFSANVMSWCWRNDTQNFTSVILYMNIIFIAQWLFCGNSEILHFSDFLHAIRNFVGQKAFSSKRVNFFYRENVTSFLNYVTATLFAWHSSYSWTITDIIWHTQIHSEWVSHH